MDVFELINALLDELGDRRGFFAKKVDLDRCVALLCELRDALPDTLSRAEQIASDRQAILTNADNVAATILHEAEERARHMVNSDQISRRAELEAERIIADAQRKCDALVEHTKQHLDECFRDAERYFGDCVTLLRTNRDELRRAVMNK